MPTLFQSHVQRWVNCRLCELCEGRQRVVLGRGKVPCDILFVGEAPGESENVLGAPFVGPAGQLLDHVVRQALANVTRVEIDDQGNDVLCEYRVAFTNLVACIPRDEDGEKTAEPEPEYIEKCRPRLDEFVKLADPKLVVCVGALAQNWLLGMKVTSGFAKFHREIPAVSITHPAAILRANPSQKGLMVQKCVIVVSEAVEEL